jgi:hypothetical protein
MLASNSARQTAGSSRQQPLDLLQPPRGCGSSKEDISRGLKPGFGVILNARTEVRAYLRSNGNGNSNSKGKGKGKAKYRGLSTPAAKCAASGRDDVGFLGGRREQAKATAWGSGFCGSPTVGRSGALRMGHPQFLDWMEGEQATAKATAGGERAYIPVHRDVAAMDGAPERFGWSNPCLRSETWGTRICGRLKRTGKRQRQQQKQTARTKANTGVLRCAQNDKLVNDKLVNDKLVKDKRVEDKRVEDKWVEGKWVGICGGLFVA